MVQLSHPYVTTGNINIIIIISGKVAGSKNWLQQINLESKLVWLNHSVKETGQRRILTVKPQNTQLLSQLCRSRRLGEWANQQPARLYSSPKTLGVAQMDKGRERTIQRVFPERVRRTIDRGCPGRNQDRDPMAGDPCSGDRWSSQPHLGGWTSSSLDQCLLMKGLLYIHPQLKTVKNAWRGWYGTQGKEKWNFRISGTWVRSIKLYILILTDDQMHTRGTSACSNITGSSPKMSDNSGKCPHQSPGESCVGGESRSDVWVESAESQDV